MGNRFPLIIALLLGVMVHASAQDQPMVPGQIRAVKVQGNVWQVIKANGQKERLKEGDFFRQGNMIETTGNGSAVLLFDNGSVIDLRPNTKFSIDEFLVEPFDRDKVDYRSIRSEPSASVTGVHVKKGTITAKVAKLNRTSAYNISTPHGTAGIRGTVVTVSVDATATTFVVPEGSIQVTKSGEGFFVGGDTGQGQQGDTLTVTEGGQQALTISQDPSYTPPPGQIQELIQQGQQFSQTANQMIPEQPFSGAPADGGPGTGTGADDGGGGSGGGSGGSAPPALPGGFGGGGGGGGGGTSGGGTIYSQ